MNFTNIKELNIPEGKVKSITFPDGSIYVFSGNSGGNTIADYSQEYLTIESLENGNVISWQKIDATSKTIQYSTDKTNWTSAASSSNGTTLATLDIGDKLYIKGSNTQYSTDGSHYNHFTSTKTVDIYGNIMSLIYGDNFASNSTLTKEHTFECLFRQLYVVDASNLILPAMTVTSSSYGDMFHDCIYLVSAPALPATTLTMNCYIGMFNGCISLVNAPVLVAAAPTNGSYAWMFDSCSQLIYVKVMATSCADDTFYCWLDNIGGNGVIEKYSSFNGINAYPSGWTFQDIA